MSVRGAPLRRCLTPPSESARALARAQHKSPAQVRRYGEQAKQLYAEGYSLAVIGKQLGLSPTTIGTVLQEAGVRLRDNHGRPT